MYLCFRFPSVNFSEKFGTNLKLEIKGRTVRNMRKQPTETAYNCNLYHKKLICWQMQGQTDLILSSSQLFCQCRYTHYQKKQTRKKVPKLSSFMKTEKYISSLKCFSAIHSKIKILTE